MNIIVTTHGMLCDGLLDSYKMIAGDNNQIYTLQLTNEGIGVYKEKLHQLINKLSNESEVLVLCDIVGGTPYNESLMYALQNPGKIQLVSGVNLPMLIEVGLSLDTVIDSVALAEIARDAGSNAINIVNLKI